MELKLHHVNYSTKDVGAVAEFYRSLFNMKPVPSYGDAQITSQGYDRKVEFLTDGTTEFHIAPQDLGVAFRTKQSSIRSIAVTSRFVRMTSRRSRPC